MNIGPQRSTHGEQQPKVKFTFDSKAFETLNGRIQPDKLTQMRPCKLNVLGPPFQGKSVFWPAPADISSSGHEPPLTFPLVEGAEGDWGGADGAQPIKEEQALCFQRARSAGQSQFMIKKKKRMWRQVGVGANEGRGRGEEKCLQRRLGGRGRRGVEAG